MKPLLAAPAVAALLGISRAAAYREMKKMEHVVVGAPGRVALLGQRRVASSGTGGPTSQGP
ncbi:MAG: hypothetical protein Q8L48_11685 [Archangium sp.]|nr:hypothetical protein [Archangium sp.]